MALSNDELTSAVQQLQAQQALQTDGLQRISEAKFLGADGLAAVVVALHGGTEPEGYTPRDFEPISEPVIPADAAPTPSDLPAIVDVRGQLPTRQGADSYPSRELTAIDGITIHYTASPDTTTVEATAAYQVGPDAQDPFPSIAYHYYVEGDGTPKRCHDLTDRVWHSAAPGANATRVGICYAGNGSEPNVAQKLGLIACIVDACDQVGKGQLSCSGHGWDYPTSCPDDGTGASHSWIPALQSEAATRRG